MIIKNKFLEENTDAPVEGAPAEEVKKEETKVEDVKPEDKKEESKISDKEKSLLDEVMKRKAKQKEYESQINELKANLSKFDGIDLEEVTNLLNERKTAQEKKLEEQGQWDKLKAQMKIEHEKDVQTKSTRIAELEGELKNKVDLIERLTLGNSFASSKFREELTLSANKAKTLYGDHFDVVDGNIVAYDKPRGAQDRTMLVNAGGDALDFDTAFKKILDSDPDGKDFYRQLAKPGAGSSTTNAKPSTKNTQSTATGFDRILEALNSPKK